MTDTPMTDTAVSYHGEDGEPHRPAINVKLHVAGLAFWPDAFHRACPGYAGCICQRHEALIDRAYERVQSDFWRDAASLAGEHGMGEIAQEGRSGGWLVFTDGRDPQDPGTLCPDHIGEPCEWADTDGVRDWLAGYRAVKEWAEAYIADAPRKVRELAQSLAMDELGAEPARRMFAFLAPYPGESYSEVAARPDSWCASSLNGMGPHRFDGATCAECGAPA